MELERAPPPVLGKEEEMSKSKSSAAEGRDQLIDPFGRRINYLRISVTDRCNLRCRYCMPQEGIHLARRDELLSFEEILRVVRCANELGINKVRLTGGEPLVRKDLPELVGMLKRECAIADLSLSTNGLLLSRYAEELKSKGLDRVNVSLDSLNPARFKEITRRGELKQVLEGIEAALDADLKPVKINTVVIGGFNDDEVVDLAQLALKHEDLIIRFIELMPIGQAVKEGLRFMSLERVKSLLELEFELIPASGARIESSGPARYYRIDGRGLIGFITPLSNKYCQSCNRIRLTARGALRPCLAYDAEISLKEALLEDDDLKVKELLTMAVMSKPKGHRWQEGKVTASIMAAVGG